MPSHGRIRDNVKQPAGTIQKLPTETVRSGCSCCGAGSRGSNCGGGSFRSWRSCCGSRGGGFRLLAEAATATANRYSHGRVSGRVRVANDVQYRRSRHLGSRSYCIHCLCIQCCKSLTRHFAVGTVDELRCLC